MLSNSCQYAIRAVMYLALQASASNKIGSKAVAKTLIIPPSFLAKILQELTKKHIISSSKGPKGGFYLTDENLKNPVLEIISCIDGLDAFHSCFFGLKTCSNDKPCAVHHTVAPFKKEIFDILSTNTVAQFADDIRKGNSYISISEL